MIPSIGDEHMGLRLDDKVAICLYLKCVNSVGAVYMSPNYLNFPYLVNKKTKKLIWGREPYITPPYHNKKVWHLQTFTILNILFVTVYVF